MDLDLGNTRTLALTPARSTVTMTPIVAQGERGEQGLPGVGSAAWTAATAVTTGTTRQAPDGSWIKSKASRTTRASFDATEEAFWDVVFATEGTLEFEALERFVSYLPAPNGVDDTDAIQAALDAGGYIKARTDCTYLTTGLVATNPAWLEVNKSTKIQLLDGAGDGAGTHAVLAIQSSGFAVTGGGVFDGNRDGQDKTAFNAAGGSSGGHYLFGIAVQGEDDAELSDVIVDATIINCADSGFSAQYVDGGSSFKVDVSSGGSGAAVSNATGAVVDVTCRSIDNAGWKVFPHVLDLNDCTHVDASLSSTDHFGDGNVDDETALSNWISGLTAINCEHVTINGLRLEARDDDSMSRGLAVSLLSCRNLTVYGTRLVGYTDCALELGGVIDSQFIGGVIDGRYNTGPGSYAGRGISAYNIGFVRDRSHRVTRYSENVTFTDFVVERHMGDALVIEAARDLTFVNTKFRSNQRGVLSKYAANDPTDTVAQSARPITGLQFIGCDFERNEQSGFDAYDLTHSKFFGCNFDRNGQANSGGGSDSTHTRNGQARDTAAAGFKTRTSTSPLGNKEGLEFHGCKFDETQYDTALAGPAVTYGSINPSDPTVVSLADDAAVAGAGQTIKLMGAGVASADLTTMIDDDDLDEITLHVAASTQPTVSGSGTISSSGTTITGTTFTTQFNARYWITAAGQTRRVVKVASATSATTDTAFSPALPGGTSFVIHKVEIRTIPSQQWAALLSADTIAARFYGGTNPVGNATGVFSDANSATNDRARFFGIPGQTSYFGNSVFSAGSVRAQRDTATEVAIGNVGPGSQSGITAGNGDVNLYVDGASRWKTDDALVVGTSLRVGQYATGSRPTASSVAAGGMIYDTTLSMPVFSNGTVWKDAAGNTV